MYCKYNILVVLPTKKKRKFESTAYQPLSIYLYKEACIGEYIFVENGLIGFRGI